MPTIVPVVEGHGEVPSIRSLVYLVLAHAGSEVAIEVGRPIRIPKSKLLREGELERAVQLATHLSGPDGLVLIMVDADEDCAADLGPEIQRRGQRVTSARVGAALPVCEYEAWLLASAEALAGKRGLPGDLAPPENPEDIRDAKGWISSQLAADQSYRETVDQPRLTASIDVDAALQARSFKKLYKEIVSFAEDSE